MPLLQEIPSSPLRSRASEEDRIQKIRIKNRRKLYLDRHPSYFTSPDLELVDPLLYDRCIRRFQTAAEREADGKAKGYSGVLEADLYRSEAKLAAVRNAQPKIQDEDAMSPYSSLSQLPAETKPDVPFVSYLRGSGGEILPEEEDEVPQSKEEGLERWKFEMTLKFLRGEDQDFDYKDVDESEEFDVIAEMEEEEKWFDDEEPEWVDESEEGITEGEAKKGTGGETGVQDY